MSQQNTAASGLSKPAEELLEQYTHYRDDGIVEIREAIPCDSQAQEKKKEKRKLKPKPKPKPKRSAIINPLNSNSNKNKNEKKISSSTSIAGRDDSWWDNMCKAENKVEADCKHKLNNIALMQKYETEKDPSPFNTENRMDLQKDWDSYLKLESEKHADQYFKNRQQNNENENKNKNKNKKVKFATNLVTKQASSEDAKPASKRQLEYGDLVGFFNKKSKKKSKKKNNPYLDSELIKECGDFMPDKNQSFEHKFDPKQPTIICSNEFKSNDKKIANDSCSMPAFNGRVFERKPPDIQYVDDGESTNDKNNINDKKQYIPPQTLPKISSAKTSLSVFRKRRSGNATIATQTSERKKVRFANKLVTKKLIIEEDDKYREKEDICLLFLDVDGVLNCSYSPSLSGAHILRLKSILNRTRNCKICISSSWRVYKQTRIELLNGLKRFADIDVHSIVIGDTPKLAMDALKGRAQEIKTYLETDAFLNCNYNVLAWCAIDDIPLDTINRKYTAFMKNNFIKTNPAKGLTDSDVEKVIFILNGRKSNKKLQPISEKEGIKILFLDVDGVLNYRDFDDGALCRECLFRLKRILVSTDCRIVLSTSWRRIASAKELLFGELSSIISVDVNKYVIGDTPVLGSQMEKPVEICQYLHDIKKTYQVISWIAIDDLPLNKIATKETQAMLENHFVKTDIKVGLSDENVLTAISILNANKP